MRTKPHAAPPPGLPSRLPAVLLLLLSWFLPATTHAQVTHQITTVSAAAWRAEQQHSGARQLPHPAPELRAWPGQGGTTGSPAGTLAAGLPGVRPGWAAVVPEPSQDVPTARRPRASAARAPPSTGH
ncbi:hypothetical protein FXF51_50330 [Nonomuraea sp. PA05]|uniref:hypothetical protein n=1 Tax=Nonomuraea sp. PA05 TaxID=2604466 RepID=UPI0011D37E7B|nr:hypothetical protein [Nonomuraea sp. PA05]TYB52987.1 hypothetical protein FXF51_50330 [Nonomuraea sp. PA05]